MSALFGLVRFDGSTVHREELAHMADALSGHGDDGVSICVDKNVGFGHVLRIVTPEDRFERQPILDISTGNHVLFCGRLDNRAELLNQLDPQHAVCSEIPDSAIATEAFRKWGSKCAARLIGDFVLVVWQGRYQRIVVVRGALSDRTLFYFLGGNGLAFATSPLALFALPFVPKELNRDRLADYVVRAPLQPNSTFFRDIYSVEGGAVTTIGIEGSISESFWQPDSLPQIRLSSDAEYEEALLERFDLAVSARLRSAFPIAAMMSGGIDSSSVACTAASELAQSGQRLHVFTQVPRTITNEIANEYYTDETPFVQAIARKYPNMDLHLVPTKAECVLARHPPFVAAAGAPFRNMGNRPWMEEILHRARQIGARTILTGALGNVAFSWNGRGVLPGMLLSRQFGKAWRHAQAHRSKSTIHALIGQGVMPLLPGPLWLAVMRLRDPENPLVSAKPPWTATSPLRREFVNSLHVCERARDNGCNLLGNPDRSSLTTRVNFLRFGEALSPEITCGLEALHGVESRDPTVDRRVVEFCLSIPEEQFQRGGVSRSLPRRTMADRWPPEVAANNRRGLQGSDWYPLLLETRPALRTILDRLSSSPLAVESLDLERIRKILDGVADAPRDSFQTYVDVHQILYLGLGLGQFLEWIEAG